MSDKDCKDFYKQIERMMKKAEKEHLRRVAVMGCYVCSRHAEIHHIRRHTGLSLRPSHYLTIPLCYRHHRTNKDSIHLGKKLFIQKYGTEQEILKQVKERINSEYSE